MESPIFESVRSDARCESGYVFLTPDGHTPMILDNQGELVWTARSSAPIQNFRVQKYRGQDYLTYWSGKPFGRGYYYMLDSSYNERYVVSPVGDIYGHPHDFIITSRGTALITAHDKRPADLSSVGGPKNGWIFDGVFQEINIASGNLVFEWRASEHVPIAHTYKRLEASEGTLHHPFDYFHINNVDQDTLGNYIISAGHTQAVSCIEKETGNVLWNMGGKANSFKDPAERPMVQFHWPHEARWYGNDTLTVLESDGEHYPGSPPTQNRGMLISVDVSRGLATKQHIYTNPKGTETCFEGNMQLLEDTGNAFVGWGGRAGYSEFSTEGKLLCDVRFGESRFFRERRGGPSRVFKGSWVGTPLTKPAARVVGRSIFVNWNGATEVAQWQLQAQLHSSGIIKNNDQSGEGMREEIFHGIARFEKTGFETTIATPLLDQDTKFRLVALDRKGVELGHTDILDLRASLVTTSGLSHAQLYVLIALCSVGGMMTVLTTLHLRANYRRQSMAEFEERDLKPYTA
ncbi:ASST-domain-containing protein [Talaromyces proteolyticus]|uniref:ASST-domain-containing protein n=1 Tax=Talaromyces proteolyticus TaxID=1131652 RepID=A0AAD4PYN1_9EURO|nr:ASST-domain-containing protein [Talaromyces proteolyticus]KAH8697904.1 ASST-domain-containing protein [Talaromyces proteolyticus]